MAQQINLCSPILLTQKRYFSANTMAVALLLFLALGSALCGTWVWNLDRATRGLRETMDAQRNELAALKAAIVRNKESAAPVDAALTRQLQERRAAVQEREQLRAALLEGLVRPGEAHSDRLQLIARTIPSQVWITAVTATARRFEISGYTLEPAALNDWVARLASSPLMQGLVLSDVSVENTIATPTKVSGAAVSSGTAVARPAWSFHLVNSQPVKDSEMGAANVGTNGGKP